MPLLRFSSLHHLPLLLLPSSPSFIICLHCLPPLFLNTSVISRFYPFHSSSFHYTLQVPFTFFPFHLKSLSMLTFFFQPLQSIPFCFKIFLTFLTLIFPSKPQLTPSFPFPVPSKELFHLPSLAIYLRNLLNVEYIQEERKGVQELRKTRHTATFFSTKREIDTRPKGYTAPSHSRLLFRHHPTMQTSFEFLRK